MAVKYKTSSLLILPCASDFHHTMEPAGATAVRTIPPWVQDATEGDVPVDLSSPTTSRWAVFVRASDYPHENFTGKEASQQWMDENWGDYSRPWLADREQTALHIYTRPKRAWYQRVQFTILRNGFVPLVLRLTTFTFAAAALALGASIYQLAQTSNPRNYQGGPSAMMALIIDAIALVYIAYITKDEYFSKPLGLRHAKDKVRLILLDLFFIIFQTANLSLAFESMSDDFGACKASQDDRTNATLQTLCERTESLASVLLVSLIGWFMTFSISVLR